MRQDYDQFVERETEIVVVGPEGRDPFARYWQANELPFVGLSDSQHTAARLYGQEVKLLKLGRLPAQVIVDKSGTIRYAHYGRSMADLPSNDQLFALLDQLNQETEAP